MAEITEIRDAKRMVEISVDGYPWLKVCKKHFYLLHLDQGDEIDCEHTIDRLAQLQAKDAYEAALSILDRASCTQRNLQEKLIKLGYVRPSAEAAAARLKEIGLINDREYAMRLSEAQLSKSVGVYALQRKLRSKRLSDEDIEAAMESFDNEQQTSACLRMAEKLWPKYSDLRGRDAKAKLSQALARRGFGWNVINSVIDNLMDNETEWSDDD